MRLNSTTPKTSAAAVKIRLYTTPNVVTVPVPKVAMRKISIGDVMGLSWTSNLEVAEKFAGRFGRQGTIWKTVLEPEKILAAYADDGEHEVLAIVSENTVNNVREFS